MQDRHFNSKKLQLSMRDLSPHINNPNHFQHHDFTIITAELNIILKN